jgi:hypothetical protein
MFGEFPRLSEGDYRPLLCRLLLASNPLGGHHAVGTSAVFICVPTVPATGDSWASPITAHLPLGRLTFQPICSSLDETSKTDIAPEPLVVGTPGDTADHLEALRRVSEQPSLPDHRLPESRHCCSFAGTLAYNFVGFCEFQTVLAYFMRPPRLSKASRLSKYLSLLESVEAGERLPGESRSSYDRYLNNALCLTEHYPQVAQIYLHSRRRNPDVDLNRRGFEICGEGQLGEIPNAFLCDDRGDPNLASALARPPTNLASIHQYCADRGIPYELWGGSVAPGWYNPRSHEYSSFILDGLLREFGPISTIPVLSQMPGSEAKHNVLQ